MTYPTIEDVDAVIERVSKRMLKGDLYKRVRFEWGCVQLDGSYDENELAAILSALTQVCAELDKQAAEASK